MPSGDIKILEFNQCCKSDKAPFIIYADFKSSLGKIYGCKNNPEKSSTAKISGDIPSSFSMSTVYYLIIDIENKHESLTEHAMKKNNLKK